jgi:hypothetical protein
MLDDIGKVNGAAVQARLREGRVEKPPGGSHERTPEPVLHVSGLLAHERHRRVRIAFAEHGLDGVPPQRAGLASLGSDARGAKGIAGAGTPDALRVACQ